jgi:iron complex transport system substrate-binding protein
MRIASLQPSITLTLAALGRLDALCAVTKYCLEAMPELADRKLPVLHDSWTADTTEIVAARPDLVIASVPYRMESLAAILKAGLPVLALAPHSLADIYGDIRLIGSVVHADAEPLIAEMRSAIETARRRSDQLAPEARPLVYCEEWGKPLIHSQHWVAELVEAAGGWFLGVPGAHTTAEEIAARDPDVMIFAWCGAGNRVPLDRVIAQRGWHGLRTVRNGRVHCIQDEYLNTPAPSLLKGLEALAAAIHPAIHAIAPER